MCGRENKNPPYANVSIEIIPELDKCATDQIIPDPKIIRGWPERYVGIPKNTASSKNPALIAREIETGIWGTVYPDITVETKFEPKYIKINPKKW